MKSRKHRKPWHFIRRDDPKNSHQDVFLCGDGYLISTWIARSITIVMTYISSSKVLHLFTATTVFHCPIRMVARDWPHRDPSAGIQYKGAMLDFVLGNWVCTPGAAFVGTPRSSTCSCAYSMGYPSWKLSGKGQLKTGKNFQPDRQPWLHKTSTKSWCQENK